MEGLHLEDFVEWRRLFPSMDIEGNVCGALTLEFISSDLFNIASM